MFALRGAGFVVEEAQRVVEVHRHGNRAVVVLPVRQHLTPSAVLVPRRPGSTAVRSATRETSSSVTTPTSVSPSTARASRPSGPSTSRTRPWDTPSLARSRSSRSSAATGSRESRMSSASGTARQARAGSRRNCHRTAPVHRSPTSSFSARFQEVERLTAGDRVELGADADGQSGVRYRKTGVDPPGVIGSERKSHSDCGGRRPTALWDRVIPEGLGTVVRHTSHRDPSPARASPISTSTLRPPTTASNGSPTSRTRASPCRTPPCSSRCVTLPTLPTHGPAAVRSELKEQPRHAARRVKPGKPLTPSAGLNAPRFGWRNPNG